MYALGYNLSVAAAVGFIALFGLSAGTTVVMVSFLDQTWQETVRDLRARSDAAWRQVTADDLKHAVVRAATSRVRPLMMTMFTDLIGRLPIMWGTGTGSEVMRRVAAPMWGGMLSVIVLTLILTPAIFVVVKQSSVGHAGRQDTVDLRLS